MWDKNKNKRIWYPHPESHSTGRAPFCSKSFILQEELGSSHFSKMMLDFYFIFYCMCATFTGNVMGKGWRQVCIQRWLKEKDDIEMKTFIGLIILTKFIIRKWKRFTIMEQRWKPPTQNGKYSVFKESKYYILTMKMQVWVMIKLKLIRSS